MDYSSGEQEGDAEAQSSASDDGYQKDSSTMKKKKATATQKLTSHGSSGREQAATEPPTKVKATQDRTLPDFSSPTTAHGNVGNGQHETSVKTLAAPSQEAKTPANAKSETTDESPTDRGPSEGKDEQERPKWDPTKPWRCEHCTFINGPGSRICLICCKTTFREETPPQSDSEERQQKRAVFQDTLAEADLEEINGQTDTVKGTTEYLKDKSQTNEMKPQKQQLSSIREESKSPPAQEEFTDDFIREQQEVEKEIRRRLEIQLKIEEENRRLNEGVVEEKKTVHHFQADTPETESASTLLPPLNQEETSTEFKFLPMDLAKGAGSPTVYESAIQQSHSSCQTSPRDPADGAGEPLATKTQTTPAETAQSVRPKVLYKASVATDTNDIGGSDTNDIGTFTKQSPQTSEGSPQPMASSGSVRDSRRAAFRGAKAHSLDQSLPSFLQRRTEQKGQRSSRIGNLIRTLSKTSLHTMEPATERRLYRSSSRSSIQSDMSDATPARKGIRRHGSLAEFDRPFASLSGTKDDETSSLIGGTGSSSYLSEGRKQDYYLSLEELIQQRKQEQMRAQGLELVRLVREAEQQGFTPDDLQVAMNHCGNDNPVHWLKENWCNMTETVVTLATNYGHDRRENNIGIVSTTEAQAALRRQKGNIWAAVTECVENRQRMFMELSSRGNFTRQEILTALTDNQGLIDMAYAQLTKATLKPFLMRIWGPGTGVDNDEGVCPQPLPTPPGNNPEESATDRVKDWLDSLDASQISSYKTSPKWDKGQWQQKRHSCLGTRTEGSFGDRARSSSPASSFTSQMEISDASSTSSVLQGSTSRLESILRRREVQKEREKGRKSKKVAGKRRWSLSTVFKGKSEGQGNTQTVKPSSPTLSENSMKKSSSLSTLTSATLKQGSVSSITTVSTEAVASLEPTGTRPNVFLGRFSPLKTNGPRNDSKGDMNEQNFQVRPAPSQGIVGTLDQVNGQVPSVSKTLGSKNRTTEGDKPEPSASPVKLENEVKGAGINNGNTGTHRHGHDIKTVKQLIHDARASFLSAPITPVKIPDDRVLNIKVTKIPIAAAVPSAPNSIELQTHKEQGRNIQNTQEVSASKPMNQHVDSSPTVPSTSVIQVSEYAKGEGKPIPVSVKENGSSGDQAMVSDLAGCNASAETLGVADKEHGGHTSEELIVPKEKIHGQHNGQVEDGLSTLPVTSITDEAMKCDTPAHGEAVGHTNGTGPPEDKSHTKSELHKKKPRSKKQPETETRQYASKRKNATKTVEGEKHENTNVPVAMNEKLKPNEPENAKYSSENPVNSVDRLAYSAPRIEVTEVTPSAVTDDNVPDVKVLSRTERQLPEESPTHSANSSGSATDEGRRRNSTENAGAGTEHQRDVETLKIPLEETTLATSSTDKGQSLLSGNPEAPLSKDDAKATISESVVTRRSRPPLVDDTSESILAHTQNRRLSDASAPRRRERRRSQVLEATDPPEPENIITEGPPTATGKGLYRRPSIRRSRASVDNGEDSAVRGPDGSPIIVKPQKPIERRSSTALRPGIFISKSVAASIAKLRSVPPPARKQQVQPRPSGKLPTDKQVQYKAKAEQLVKDGKCPSMVHAQLVAELVDMNFDEEDAITAAEQCDSIYQAVNFLQQECELCAANYPVSQMISLLNCVHKSCKECLKAYFTIQIRDRNIMELLCPFCNEPDLTDEDVELNYFNHLDVLLKGLVDEDVYDLFQQKLRDRALMKDPNFRWCSQCSSGFITYPDQKRLVCPDCHAVTCALCRRIWQKQHEGITCEQFQEWLDANDPNSQAEGIARYLEDNGIDCPNCKFKYALARGGCMHFKCYQCSYDFCCGCNQPFKMGEKCDWAPICAKLGLHAHHPRNCLFYLRDKEIEDLQKLLNESGITFNTKPPPHWEPSKLCQVPEQKETSIGLRDDICGKEVEEGMAGLCRKHYVEYLGQLIFRHRVDPVSIFNIDELELVLRRANKRLPSHYRLTDDEYRDAVLKIIDADIPLDMKKCSG